MDGHPYRWNGRTCVRPNDKKQTVYKDLEGDWLIDRGASKVDPDGAMFVDKGPNPCRQPVSSVTKEEDLGSVLAGFTQLKECSPYKLRFIYAARGNVPKVCLSFVVLWLNGILRVCLTAFS